MVEDYEGIKQQRTGAFKEGGAYFLNAYFGLDGSKSVSVRPAFSCRDSYPYLSISLSLQSKRLTLTGKSVSISIFNIDR